MNKDDILLSLIAGKHGLLVDVGGGDSHLKAILPNDMAYLNIDWNPKADYVIDLNSQSLPLLDESADIVVCSEVFEHLYRPNAVLAEINRIAKPDAIILITMPNEYNLYLRLRYLIGANTAHNLPFQDKLGEQHIHLPSLSNIVGFVETQTEIQEIRYLFISHRQHWIDPLVNQMAQLYPSLFCRNVIIKSKKRQNWRAIPGSRQINAKE